MIKFLKFIFRTNQQFSRKELNAIKVSLDYSWHRLTKHKKSGIHGNLNPQTVDQLRKRI